MFHGWIHDFMAGLMDMGPEIATEEGKVRAEKGKASTAALEQYLAELIEQFVRKPGEGMLSKMVHDDGPDGPMAPADVANNAILLLVAGHDSTVNTIAHCVIDRAAKPRIHRASAPPAGADPRRHRGGRCASSRRFSSFPAGPPWPTSKSGGRSSRRVRPVFLMYGAANRDPSRFPNPSKFDPERRGQRALRLGQRHPHLLRRSARAAGGEPRVRDLPSPRGEPAAGRRPAAVPAEQCLPRTETPVDRLRPDQRLKGQTMKAFQFVEAQKPAELREVPVPEPGPGSGTGQDWGRWRLPLRPAHT